MEKPTDKTSIYTAYKTAYIQELLDEHGGGTYTETALETLIRVLDSITVSYILDDIPPHYPSYRSSMDIHLRLEIVRGYISRQPDSAMRSIYDSVWGLPILSTYAHGPIVEKVHNYLLMEVLYYKGLHEDRDYTISEVMEEHTTLGAHLDSHTLPYEVTISPSGREVTLVNSRPIPLRYGEEYIEEYVRGYIEGSPTVHQQLSEMELRLSGKKEPYRYTLSATDHNQLKEEIITQIVRHITTYPAVHLQRSLLEPSYIDLKVWEFRNNLLIELYLKISRRVRKIYTYLTHHVASSPHIFTVPLSKNLIEYMYVQHLLENKDGYYVRRERLNSYTTQVKNLLKRTIQLQGYYTASDSEQQLKLSTVFQPGVREEIVELPTGSVGIALPADYYVTGIGLYKYICLYGDNSQPTGYYYPIVEHPSKLLQYIGHTKLPKEVKKKVSQLTGNT